MEGSAFKRLKRWLRHTKRFDRKTVSFLLSGQLDGMSYRRSRPSSDEREFDLILVGGGTAALMAALFAGERGARVLILEASPRIGGTLFLSNGHLSAAGTQVQREKGISDSWQEHFDDVMRISAGTADPDMVRLAVENAADTFDWLMSKGLVLGSRHPVSAGPHEPYRRARVAWGREGGLSILEILVRELRPLTEDGRVSIRTRTKALRLIYDAEGSVVGVEGGRGKGAPTQYRARHVALTSGGYTGDFGLFRKLHGHEKYSDTAYPQNLGAGLRMGLDAGGFLRGQERHLPDFGRVLADEKFPSPTIGRLVAVHERPAPWEIYVNARGERFVREDDPSIHRKEEALLAQPGHRFWAVFDDTAFRQAAPLIGGWSRGKLGRAFRWKSNFHRAKTIETLARQANIDPEGLAASVADYNESQVQASRADALGREVLPAPIRSPPFYAVLCHGCTLTASGGLAVDRELRVIDEDGRPIVGLFAAGEILGSASFSGRARCGGMSLTPALTLGRLLGQEFLDLSQGKQ